MQAPTPSERAAAARNFISSLRRMQFSLDGRSHCIPSVAMKDSMLAVVLVAACGTSSPPPPAPPAHPATSETASKPAPAPSQVSEITFHADHLGVDKKMDVYLPAGYD